MTVSDTPVPPDAEGSRCGGCVVTDRRAFLLDAFRAGVAALVALGVSPSAAEAAPLRWITAWNGSRQEKLYPVPSGDGVQIDKDNEVILARVGKAIYAFSLACPHQNTALRWEAGDNRFQCPKHKSRYRPDGTFIEGRATRSMDRYAVKAAGTNISVDIDTLYQEDTDLAHWQQAVVTLP